MASEELTCSSPRGSTRLCRLGDPLPSGDGTHRHRLPRLAALRPEAELLEPSGAARERESIALALPAQRSDCLDDLRTVGLATLAALAACALRLARLAQLAHEQLLLGLREDALH